MFTIRDRLLAGFMLATVVLCSVVYIKHKQIQSLEAKADNSAAQVAGYKEYTAKHQAVTKQKEESNARIEAVLAEHVEFADLPVPDDVADILRKHPVPR